MFSNISASVLFLLIPILIALYYFRFKDRKNMGSFQSEKSWVGNINLVAIASFLEKNATYFCVMF